MIHCAAAKTLTLSCHTDMKNHYQAIFFDFDGTLVDTAPGIIETMRQTFRLMGLPIPAEKDMRASIGIPLGKALRQLGHLDDEGEDRAVEIYRQLFVRYELGNLNIFPGVEETLSKLQSLGMRMAIVTSRDEASLELIVKPRGLQHFFETVVTGSDGLPAKPAPDLVNLLLERMNLLPGEVLVVGDTTFDIQMGNNALCDTCAVTYGNHDEGTLLTSSPTYTIDTFSELLRII